MRISLVHRAFDAISAAGHPGFRGWLPPGAHRGVPRHEGERERESRETLDEPNHGYRMLDGRGAVKHRGFLNPAGGADVYEREWTEGGTKERCNLVGESKESVAAEGFSAADLQFSTGIPPAAFVSSGPACGRHRYGKCSLHCGMALSNFFSAVVDKPRSDHETSVSYTHLTLPTICSV